MPGRRFFSAGVLWLPKNALKLTVYNQKSDRLYQLFAVTRQDLSPTTGRIHGQGLTPDKNLKIVIMCQTSWRRGSTAVAAVVLARITPGFGGTGRPGEFSRLRTIASISSGEASVHSLLVLAAVTWSEALSTLRGLLVVSGVWDTLLDCLEGWSWAAELQ